jgi:molecular chaperone DnaK (HSP70)
MAKILGIDLGTTHCCIAVIAGGEPSVLENSGARASTAQRGHAEEPVVDAAAVDERLAR